MNDFILFDLVDMLVFLDAESMLLVRFFFRICYKTKESPLVIIEDDTRYIPYYSPLLRFGSCLPLLSGSYSSMLDGQPLIEKIVSDYLHLN